MTSGRGSGGQVGGGFYRRSLSFERAELQQMQRLRELLTEIYIVLVIPDRKKSTIELAHLFAARFLSQQENDFTGISNSPEQNVYKSSLAPCWELFQEA